MNTYAMAIAQEIATRRGDPWRDIIGWQRSKCLVETRRKIVAVLYDDIGLSFTEIAKILGRTNHSSMLDAYQRYNEATTYAEHKQFANTLIELRKWRISNGQILPSGVPADRPDQDTAASHAGIQPAKSPRRSDRGSGDVGGTIRPGPRRRRAYNHDSGKWETVGI